MAADEGQAGMQHILHALWAVLENPDNKAAQAALEEQLPEAGIDVLRQAANDDPANPQAALAVVGRMVMERAPHDELSDVARALASRAPKDERGYEVVLASAGVLRALHEAPQALEPLYRRVRRSRPADPEVLAFYREFFAEAGQATQLIQVLLAAFRASATEATRFELAKEVAELAEQSLGNRDRAIEMWRTLLKQDASPYAVAELQRLYTETNKWTALVDLLKDEAERAEEPARKLALFEEVAALYRDALHLPTMAVATLERMLDVNPHHEPTLVALTQAYDAAGRENELVSLYQRRIAAAREGQDDTLRAALLLERVKNPLRALEPLKELVEVVPHHAEANGMLARIYEDRRDFRALIALRRKALPTLAPQDALDARVQLAKLAEERLGDRKEAIAAWQEVVDQHGPEREALLALFRLYQRESQWHEAAHTAEALVEHTEDDEEAAQWLEQVALLYQERLRQDSDALRCWQALLARKPGHERALRRLRDLMLAQRQFDELAALYTQEGRLSELVDVLHGAADRIGDDADRVELYRKLAAICRDELHQPERAVKALERTLAIQPKNLDVARELVPIYAEQQNWARLMSTYELLLDAAKDQDEQWRVVVELKNLAKDALQSPTLTLRWAARAYALRPQDEGARRELEDVAQWAEGWDQLGRAYDERLHQPDVRPDEQLLLLEKLAANAAQR